MELESHIQGWQDMPADLLDCVAARLSKRDHQAVSVVCKCWKQVIRHRSRKAAISDARNIEAVLHSFPSLTELHLNGIQTAVSEQAVHAAARHTSLRSLQLNSCSFQPALLGALAAAGKLRELYIQGVEPPALPNAQLQVTGWSGLRELHIEYSHDILNVETILDLSSLVVIQQNNAGHSGHDLTVEHSSLAQLPVMPELENLVLIHTGITSHHHIVPRANLTSLGLMNELQLPDNFFADLRLQTALRCLDLSRLTGPQPATLTDANIAAVLPHLRHLVFLSLAGCDTLHMSCLHSLHTACTELKHLNIANLQRSGATLHVPDHLTKLNLSGDRGSIAEYRLALGLLHLDMRNSFLGNWLIHELPTACPNLRYLDARGCVLVTSHRWAMRLAECRHLEVLLLDGSDVGCNGIAYLMMTRADLRLAEDVGSDTPWSFEPWALDAVILLKQAEVTLRNRGFVRFAFLLGAFDHMVGGLSCFRLVFWWLGVALSGRVPVGRQYISNGLLHSYLAVLIPVTLRLMEVSSIGRLGVLLLEFACSAITSTHYIRPFILGLVVVVEGWSFLGRITSVCVFVARWLESPTFKRIRDKPTASRIIPFAAALFCAGWVSWTESWHMLRLTVKASAVMPFPIGVLAKGLSICWMLVYGLQWLFTLCHVCLAILMRK